VVARSTRLFLRPFFLHAAEAIGVPAEELPACLRKNIGELIDHNEVIAAYHGRRQLEKKYHSPVRGRIERILPGGVLLVRESPEEAKEYTTVDAAQELGIYREDADRYVRVKKGDEVERGQWLAAIIQPGRTSFCSSPVRGRVNRVERGMVVIEPLLEELAVKAWLPGTVVKTSDRGCTVAGRGVFVTAAWGHGAESSGVINLSSPGKGRVFVTGYADAGIIAKAEQAGSAGLICAGVDAADALAAKPGLVIVATEGFGRRDFSPAVLAALKAGEGRLCLLDGRTQLRVGVRRPRIIIPD
jgi:hypothetical protein